jgi:hydroxymethylpyrimidine/phosphomethylpyrimidine kinase
LNGKPVNSKPVVLAFSGHDPSGAAGIQADIESIHHNGGQCVSVLTALTAQNTSNFESILPQSPASFRKQATLLLSDIKVDACKTGLIGSNLLIYEICEILLTGKKSREAAAEELIQRGCQAVLITGADLSTAEVINTLHLKDDPVYEFKWERLPGHYHGSGCTLSATIAVLLSRKIELLNAIEQAQKYTWETLKYAKHYGNLQLHPDRSHRK